MILNVVLVGIVLRGGLFFWVILLGSRFVVLLFVCIVVLWMW